LKSTCVECGTEKFSQAVRTVQDASHVLGVHVNPDFEMVRVYLLITLEAILWTFAADFAHLVR
jgi:hypothetical protein